MKFRNPLVVVSLTLVLALPACAARPAAVVIPATPDGTIKAVATHLAEGHPEILWMALPPSYQKDLTEVTHLFGAKMDAELYAKVFNLARKIVTVLTAKKAIILDMSMLAALGEERAKVERNWDSALAICTTLFNSELANLEQVKTLDWQAFLAGSGAKLMTDVAAISKNDPADPYENDFRAKLTAVTVDKVAETAETATLRVTAPGEEPQELLLVKVEGRWVPAEMAAEWTANMTRAKERLNALTPEEVAQTRVQAMLGLAMAEGLVDQVAAVTTSAELETLLQGLFGGLMNQMGAQPQQVTTPEIAPATTPTP